MKLIKQIFECKSVQTEQKWPNMTWCNRMQIKLQTEVDRD